MHVALPPQMKFNAAEQKIFYNIKMLANFKLIFKLPIKNVYKFHRAFAYLNCSVYSPTTFYSAIEL